MKVSVENTFRKKTQANNFCFVSVQFCGNQKHNITCPEKTAFCKILSKSVNGKSTTTLKCCSADGKTTKSITPKF